MEGIREPFISEDLLAIEEYFPGDPFLADTNLVDLFPPDPYLSKLLKEGVSPIEKERSAPEEELSILKPQEGFQRAFMSSKADIVLGGGAAGVGKSFAEVMDNMKNTIPRADLLEKGIIDYTKFRSIFFRRTQVEIKLQGGIWEEATSLARQFGSQIKESKSLIVYPSGASSKFSHLQYDADLESHRSGQYDLIYFDELTTFTAKQFWFMLSRNRSRAGFRPQIKATTNPQGQGWVKTLIEWWLYPDDHSNPDLQGKPIPERSGVLRYFYRYGGVLFWGNTREEVIENLPEEAREKPAADPVNRIKSITFIAGKLTDNQILLDRDPGYEGNLLALEPEDRAKYYEGSWKFFVTAETLFTPRMLEDAFTAEYVKLNRPARVRRYLTCDIALEGADKFILACWENWHLYRLEIIDKCNGKEVEKIIRRVMAEERIPASRVAFDSGGVGNFLSGFFKSAIPVNNGSGPRKRLGEEERDFYENMRAQLYYMFREKLREDTPEVYLEAIGEDLRPAVMQAFTAHKKKELPSMKLAVIPKKLVKEMIGGKSPDIPDALVLRAAFLLDWEEEEEDIGYFGTVFHG